MGGVGETILVFRKYHRVTNTRRAKCVKTPSEKLAFIGKTSLIQLHGKSIKTNNIQLTVYIENRYRYTGELFLYINYFRLFFAFSFCRIAPRDR